MVEMVHIQAVVAVVVVQLTVLTLTDQVQAALGAAVLFL